MPDTKLVTWDLELTKPNKAPALVGAHSCGGEAEETKRSFTSGSDGKAGGCVYTEEGSHPREVGCSAILQTCYEVFLQKQEEGLHWVERVPPELMTT